MIICCVLYVQKSFSGEKLKDLMINQGLLAQLFTAMKTNVPEYAIHPGPAIMYTDIVLIFIKHISPMKYVFLSLLYSNSRISKSVILFVLNCRDQNDWKQYLSTPSIPFVLQIMNALANGHARAQRAIAEFESGFMLHLLHRIEQLPSEEALGSHAEVLLDTLCQDTQIGATVSVSVFRTVTYSRTRILILFLGTTCTMLFWFALNIQYLYALVNCMYR